MANILKDKAIPERDLHYYRQRLKNRIHSDIAGLFNDEAERKGLTKKDIAERLSRDPGQITRWLTTPTNLTLETISDLLLAMDADLETRALPFDHVLPANEVHPLIAKVIDSAQPVTQRTGARSNAKARFEMVGVK
ncbi:MAG: helix-turn-helix domain-containing protein [Pseudomonadota bacterium]